MSLSIIVCLIIALIVDLDPEYQGTGEWYEVVAQSRPPKDRPWYHILVHDSTLATYLAERSLEVDASGKPVNHPMFAKCFLKFIAGRYICSHRMN